METVAVSYGKGSWHELKPNLNLIEPFFENVSGLDTLFEKKYSEMMKPFMHNI